MINVNLTGDIASISIAAFVLFLILEVWCFLTEPNMWRANWAYWTGWTIADAGLPNIMDHGE